MAVTQGYVTAMDMDTGMGSREGHVGVTWTSMKMSSRRRPESHAAARHFQRRATSA